MGDKDKSLKDIKSGKGLKPIKTQSTGTKFGLTTEQRNQYLDCEKYIVTKQDNTKNSGNKNGR